MNNSKAKNARVFDFVDPLPPALYWDSSFIINVAHADGRWHGDCVAFGERLERSDTFSYVSTLALDEAWFVLLQLMVEDDYKERSFWRIANNSPSVVAKYVGRLEKITNDIYAASRVRVVSVGSNTPRLALKNMRDFYLLPRDALHLATMRQYKLTHLVTTDADFLPVHDLSIYTCNPALRPSR
ncbi:MAG: type II toxin-antitoxin system VapC family toxin [Chloroflexi bacterium]|nr:type II toxin-antitoxin system VapC family toxin [Chloroflexota bacterium]